MDYSPWDREESDTTEQLTHTHTHIHTHTHTHTHTRIHTQRRKIDIHQVDSIGGKFGDQTRFIRFIIYFV